MVKRRPAPPEFQKMVAMAIFYGVRVYKRNESAASWNPGITLRRGSSGWAVPLHKAPAFARPDARSSYGKLPIAEGGPTLDQWITLFKDLEAGGGWTWAPDDEIAHECEWTI